MADDRTIEDLDRLWRERGEHSRRSQARMSPMGMMRPPRDPDERAFVAARGQLGPIVEHPTAPARTAD